MTSQKELKTPDFGAMTFGQRLEYWCTARFGSPEAYLKRGRVSKSQLWGWIKGLYNPGKDKLEILMEDGCNLNWLVKGVGPMDIEQTAIYDNDEIEEFTVKAAFVVNDENAPYVFESVATYLQRKAEREAVKK